MVPCTPFKMALYLLVMLKGAGNSRNSHALNLAFLRCGRLLNLRVIRLVKMQRHLELMFFKLQERGTEKVSVQGFFQKTI